MTKKTEKFLFFKKAELIELGITPDSQEHDILFMLFITNKDVSLMTAKKKLIYI